MFRSVNNKVFATAHICHCIRYEKVVISALITFHFQDCQTVAAKVFGAHNEIPLTKVSKVPCSVIDKRLVPLHEVDDVEVKGAVTIQVNRHRIFGSPKALQSSIGLGCPGMRCHRKA